MHWTKTELIRVVLPLCLGILLIRPWDPTMGGYTVPLYALGIIFIMAAMSHVVRKLLFPYVHLQVYAEKAKENPIASAIVFLATCYIVSIFLQAFLHFIAK